MKVALVHDYIKEYGGAERVLEVLHEIWPKAPVYTSVYLPKFLGPHRERFKNWEIRESWVKYIPFKEKLISPLRLIAPLLFRQFDFSEFDVVIVSATGAYNPNIINCHPELVSGSHIAGKEMPKQVRHDTKKKPVHVCYCHTPPRYLYGYATAREWKKNLILRSIGELFNHFLRIVDFKSAQNVDYFIANSKEVASRIKKFYRREATVIYPPVSICHPEFISGSQHSKNEMPKPFGFALPSQTWRGFAQGGQVRNDKEHGYYLAGGRIARPKNIDLIVRACRELKVPLKVFGRGFAGYERKILSDKDIKILSERKSSSIKSPNILISQYPNIQFLGEVSDEEKWELMRNARVYIFASEDEDFGITPVEAMAVGTPVIAYRCGGVVESVVERKTGVFFDELTVESLAKAIKLFDHVVIKSADCIRQAQKFSKERFKRGIAAFVTKHAQKQ